MINSTILYDFVQQKLIRRMAMEMKNKKMSENVTRADGEDLTEEKEDQVGGQQKKETWM